MPGKSLKSRPHRQTARGKWHVSSKSNEEKSILDDIEGEVRQRPRHSNISNYEDPDDVFNDPHWSPTPYSAFKLFISARFAAALWTTISDCDETFNYWEPTHYLLYGKGFQTWEYSPEFALRSYTYILLHAVPAKIYDFLLKPTPLLIFFFIRCFLSFICASSEAYLYRSVRKKFGGNVARISLMTSLFSAGMYISSCAYLPSSFSMYMTAFAFGAWLDGLQELAIFFVALSGILSWPFAALTGALIAVDILFVQRQWLLFVKWSLLSLIVILGPVTLLDSNLYGKLVVAPWNIVKYNIFSSKGPDLYGTEPWTFYFINGTLNFNLMYAFALFAPVFILLSYKIQFNVRKKLFVLGTIYLWMLVFGLQSHKEERFMFPIFCLFPIAGALGIDATQKLIDIICSKLFLRWIQNVKDVTKVKIWDYRKLITYFGLSAILTSCLVGFSRILALHYGYRAPFDVYFTFHREPFIQKSVQQNKNLTLCYGKEWYRYPSSFFIPSMAWDVRFIKSDFEGQLPGLYPAFDPEGTRKIPSDMNDLNREETSRYVNISSCDFLVDLVLPDQTSANEPNYAVSTSEWKVVSEQLFLNSAKSHAMLRAFYVPWVSSMYTRYDMYVILQRVRKKLSKPRKRGKEFYDDEL